MENQKFCLTWKDYNANFSKEFGEFRKHEDFFDVTLACEENTITAHKIVLSAASEFFKDILRKHKHEHPLIYLTDVKFPDLQAILDFIYTGVTEVAEKDLENVLSIATRFKVKGLTDGAGGSGTAESVTTVPAMETTRKRIRIAENIMAPVKIPEEKKTKIIATSQIRPTVTVYGEPTIIKAEKAGESTETSVPIAVRSRMADPIDISSFLSPEEQQQFESEASSTVSSPYKTTVSHVIVPDGGVSQDYLNNKTELDRQCNELMVSSYDSSLGRIWILRYWCMIIFLQARPCGSVPSVITVQS